MKAVGVGYVFNLFDDGDLFGVDLRETGEYVRVDGSIYPLMKAATYEQSRMVDAALDVRGERRLDDFLWKEPRLPDGRGALAALLGGDDFYNPGTGVYLDSYLNDREPELIVRRCSLDDFESLAGRMRGDGKDYRDGAVAPFEAAEIVSDGDEPIPLDEAGGLTRIASYAEKIAGDGWIPAGADLDSFIGRAHEVAVESRPLKVAFIGVGEEPRIVEVEADWDGSHLHGLQALDGGFIEPFTPLYGDEPCLYVNEDGIGEDLAPNRAIYASRPCRTERRSLPSKVRHFDPTPPSRREEDASRRESFGTEASALSAEQVIVRKRRRRMLDTPCRVFSVRIALKVPASSAACAEIWRWGSKKRREESSSRRTGVLMTVISTIVLGPNWS